MTASTYRFIAMYTMITIVLTMVASMQTNIDDDTREFNLQSQDKISEIAQSKDDIITQSEKTIQANQYALTSGWGDQLKGGTFFGALLKGFIPVVFELSLIDKNTTGLERSAIITVLIFRTVLALFVALEIWYLWKGKVS